MRREVKTETYKFAGMGGVKFARLLIRLDRVGCGDPRLLQKRHRCIQTSCLFKFAPSRILTSAEQTLDHCVYSCLNRFFFGIFLSSNRHELRDKLQLSAHCHGIFVDQCVSHRLCLLDWENFFDSLWSCHLGRLPDSSTSMFKDQRF